MFDRGDVDAVYTWLPTLDQGSQAARCASPADHIAKDGKPTLDLAAVSDEFADAPSGWSTCGAARARALNLSSRGSRRRREGHCCGEQVEPRRGRRPTQAGRAGRRRGSLRRGERGTEGEARFRGQPAGAPWRSSWPTRNDPFGSTLPAFQFGILRPRLGVSSLSDVKPVARPRSTGASHRRGVGVGSARVAAGSRRSVR